MQSAETFASDDEEEIAEQAHEIRKAQKKQKLRPLNKDIIRSQLQYSKIILNAFQCLLQCQVNALIIEYNVKPHLYHIVGQIWFRFINQIWIKQGGFGDKSDDKSDWIWNKNQSKLYQNNDFIEKWITPKRSVLDVLLTTEDEFDTSSDDDNMCTHATAKTQPSLKRSDSPKPNAMSDTIDLNSLFSNNSTHTQTTDNVSISRSRSKKKIKKFKELTQKEKIIREKQKRLNLKRRLPSSCQRYTERINRFDPYGWKPKQKATKDKKNERSEFDEYLYESGQINLELSLVLLYIGCRLCAECLTLNDILLGAQKNVIPYLRAYESLPKEFRIKDSRERRKVFMTDANFVSFKKMFMRNEMKYDRKSFYIICNLLVRDMGLQDKIVPFNSKLMVIKYCRDLNVPLAIYSVIEVFMEKYKRFPHIFGRNNAELNAKWKELSEYGSIFVD